MQKWFLPHRDTHQKARLITWQALLVYALLFILLQNGIKIFSLAKPGVLGTSSSITQQKIIELTNAERSKIGLPPVVENAALSQAAGKKAANMFEENYWAHFAPSGKSPWDFILSSGYKFVYAGENLAKNFANSEDVVAAWMNSPSHRENVVNPKYRDIGIAVEDGILNGQKTTLVVQEFGSTNNQLVALAPTELVAQVARNMPEASVEPEVQVVPVAAFREQATQPRVVTLQQTLPATAIPDPLFDPFQASKVISVSIISILMILIFVDFMVLKRRGVFRISSHHFAHMAVLSLAAATIFSIKSGEISNGIQFRAPDSESRIMGVE